jgi:hypothetical protein
MRSLLLAAAFFVGCQLLFGMVRADEFVVLGEDGAEETLEARLIGSGQGAHALELADGRVELLPQPLVRDRKLKEAPEPVDAAAMVALLEEEFGRERLQAMVSEPYIAALVLAAPAEAAREARVRAYLRTAASFLSNVDKVFASYARLMDFPLEKPRFPLVLLIFEADNDFEEYASGVTAGNGLSAKNMAGFYSLKTNWLAVRMGECFTFEVPLHEAIHQQMYNRGVIQRFAPIPAWFNEGIATGFENDGERISGNPSKINTRYARQWRTANAVSWEQLVEDDSAFRGDVLAGDAYTHAWCLHWMLATGHTQAYRDYVQELSRREPLQELDGEERLATFARIFGTPVAQLQEDFPRQLQVAARRQRINLAESDPPGYSLSQHGPAEVKLEAVTRLDLGGQLHLRGTVRNRSPFRDWTLYLTVETDAGTYADWLLPDIRSGQTVTLQPQVAAKLRPGADGGVSRTFQVHVETALPGSEAAKEWAAGLLPAPE